MAIWRSRTSPALTMTGPRQTPSGCGLATRLHSWSTLARGMGVSHARLQNVTLDLYSSRRSRPDRKYSSNGQKPRSELDAVRTRLSVYFSPRKQPARSMILCRPVDR